MSVLRRRADAVITGGATFRAHPHAMVEDPRAVPDSAVRQAPPFNAIISRTGNVPVDAPAFADARVRPLLITGSDVSLPRGLPARVDVVQLPRVDAEGVLTALTARGATQVLLESGGDLSSMFFRAGVVDELFLTVAPLLLGGRGAPSPLDGPGWALEDAPRLTLVECTVHGGELFLRYRVPRRAP